MARYGRCQAPSSTDEKTISEDEIVYHKRQDSFCDDVRPPSPGMSRVIEHPHLSPVREEVVSPSYKAQRAMESFPTPDADDDYIPMVDKTVDASWIKEVMDEKQLALSKGAYTLADVYKGPDGFSNHILAGVMAFVMGIVTMLRVTRVVPKKIVDAAIDHVSPVYCAQTMVKAQMHQQLPASTVSAAEYSSVMKRLIKLEETVNILSMKPAEMAIEKEEQLKAAVSRVDALEAELAATKKALEDALARQEELVAYVDKKKKKKSKLNPFCW